MVKRHTETEKPYLACDNGAGPFNCDCKKHRESWQTEYRTRISSTNFFIVLFKWSERIIMYYMH